MTEPSDGFMCRGVDRDAHLAPKEESSIVVYDLEENTVFALCENCLARLLANRSEETIKRYRLAPYGHVRAYSVASDGTATEVYLGIWGFGEPHEGFTTIKLGPQLTLDRAVEIRERQARK